MRGNTELAPMFCRVDFVNALLSQELINIIAAWQESLPKPPTISAFWRKVRRREILVHQVIHQLFRIFAACASLGALAYFLPDALQGSPSLKDVTQLAVWLLLSLMLIDFCENIGHYFAVSALRSLEEYGKFVVLRMTKGDTNKQAELDEANRKSIRAFSVRFAGAVLADLVAGSIAAWIFSTR